MLGEPYGCWSLSFLNPSPTSDVHSHRMNIPTYILALEVQCFTLSAMDAFGETHEVGQ